MVKEVDDSILLGAGLRFAFIGPFLTYRIAGGEAGMSHFLDQFGPALRWPWTKLTDVPELTDALLEKIAAQSDDQAGGRSIRELERLRDDCLVSVIQALRTHDVGAGAVLAATERAMFGARQIASPSGDSDWSVSGPLRLYAIRVPPEWVDYNGHVHESRYLQMFGDASDAFFRVVGIDHSHLAECGSYFTVETHLSFLGETHAEERVEVATQVLGFDEKRLHAFHRLHRSSDDAVLAEAEHMFVHVDVGSGRAGPPGAEVLGRIATIAEAHAGLPRPERAGRSIAVPQRS
jgi:carnitine 3-dehydrogenase